MVRSSRWSIASARATSSTARERAAGATPRSSSGSSISARTVVLTTCVSGSWATIPTASASSAGPCERTSIPATSSSPSIAPPWKCGTRPQPARSRVDFPDPERPASTTNSPGSTVSSIARSASAPASG